MLKTITQLMNDHNLPPFPKYGFAQGSKSKGPWKFYAAASDLYDLIEQVNATDIELDTPTLFLHENVAGARGSLAPS